MKLMENNIHPDRRKAFDQGLALIAGSNLDPVHALSNLDDYKRLTKPFN